MPLFRYKEIKNNRTSGYRFIDAESLSLAKRRLTALKIVATKLSPYTSFRENFSLQEKHLLLLTKDLYYLLHSGLPLYESLQTLTDKYKNHKMYPMILDFADNVKYGKSLSSILKEYKKAYSSIYVSIISSAEKSGNLAKAFYELSVMIETNATWKKKIRSTLLYPLFLLSFAFVILFGLFLFIIPSIAELFEDRTLHPLTSAVLSISNWMCANLYVLYLIGILLAATGVFFYTNDRVKRYFRIAAHNTPTLKDLLTKMAIVRFTTSLYNLLESTVPILEALTLAKGSLHHPYLEEDTNTIIKEVRKGKKFSKAILSSKHFPKIFSKMVSTGEHTGSITPILKHVEALFHEEVQTALEKFTALLQPILLLFIGIIVGVVLLAVLIPLTDVSSLL